MRRVAPHLGHLAAAVALFCQLVLGTMVVDAVAAHARMAQAGLVCRTDAPAPPHAPLHHHMVDCALCPHAAALHGHTMLPVDAAGLVPPRALTFLRLVWAHGARAPPAAPGVTAYPRGPPLT